MRADAQRRGSVRRHCLCEGTRWLAWQPQCDRPHGLFYSRGGKSWLIRGTPVVCRARAGRVEAQVERAEARAARAAARVGRAAAPVAWAVAADPAVSPVVVAAWAVVADLAASPAVGGVEWVAVAGTQAGQAGQAGNPAADQVADRADRVEAQVAENPVVADQVVGPAAARVAPAAASLAVEAGRAAAVVVGSRAAAADDRSENTRAPGNGRPCHIPQSDGSTWFTKPTRHRFR
jgi:hypothetical protein